METLIKIDKALNVDISELFNATRNNPCKYEYDLITHEVSKLPNHEVFINDKANENWELVSVTQFTDTDNVGVSILDVTNFLSL